MNNMEERREEELGAGGDVHGDWFAVNHFRLGRIEPKEEETMTPQEKAMTTLVVAIMLCFLITGWDEVFPPKKEG